VPVVRGKGEGRGKGDGRVLRGRRNRDAVVDALLGLLTDGELNPTARAIAERAGISRRSVFQHFPDMESIHEAASERVTDALRPLLAPVDPCGSQARRIDELSARRRALLVVIDPIARAARARGSVSEVIRDGRRRLNDRMREQCAAAVAAELAERPGPDTDAVVTAVAAAMSWNLWDHLRVDIGLGDDEAIEIMRRLVTSVITATVGAVVPDLGLGGTG
jgi:TetR/AcrR family transcriptional regulator of autoinduction and epiphytic fitness